MQGQDGSPVRGLPVLRIMVTEAGVERLDPCTCNGLPQRIKLGL
jgi:hypothetical protein